MSAGSFETIDLRAADATRPDAPAADGDDLPWLSEEALIGPLEEMRAPLARGSSVPAAQPAPRHVAVAMAGGREAPEQGRDNQRTEPAPPPAIRLRSSAARPVTLLQAPKARSSAHPRGTSRLVLPDDRLVWLDRYGAYLLMLALAATLWVIVLELT